MGCCFSSEPVDKPVPPGTAYAVRCEPLYEAYGQQIIVQPVQPPIAYYPYPQGQILVQPSQPPIAYYPYGQGQVPVPVQGNQNPLPLYPYQPTSGIV